MSFGRITLALVFATALSQSAYAVRTTGADKGLVNTAILSSETKGDSKIIKSLEPVNSNCPSGEIYKTAAAIDVFARSVRLVALGEIDGAKAVFATCDATHTKITITDTITKFILVDADATAQIYNGIRAVALLEQGRNGGIEAETTRDSVLVRLEGTKYGIK